MFETISNWVAAILTLFIFSFLYKDNPFYRFAEHLFVGVSLGYVIPLVYKNAFVPFVWTPIVLRHQFIYIIPAMMGMMFIFRFNRKLSWLSRYPITFNMGIIGLGVPMSMHAMTLVQMRTAMLPITNINLLLIFIGTVTILLYFFFSKAHEGAYKQFTRIGVWYMMIGFGASFGYTVMGRLSLLIGRIQFLVGDVLKLIQ